MLATTPACPVQYTCHAMPTRHLKYRQMQFVTQKTTLTSDMGYQWQQIAHHCRNTAGQGHTAAKSTHNGRGCSVLPLQAPAGCGGSTEQGQFTQGHLVSSQAQGEVPEIPDDVLHADQLLKFCMSGRPSLCVSGRASHSLARNAQCCSCSTRVMP